MTKNYRQTRKIQVTVYQITQNAILTTLGKEKKKHMGKSDFSSSSNTRKLTSTNGIFRLCDEETQKCTDQTMTVQPKTANRANKIQTCGQ